MDIGAYRDHFFRPFGPHFGRKIMGGGRAPRAPPLDPSLISTRVVCVNGKYPRTLGAPRNSVTCSRSRECGPHLPKTHSKLFVY